MALFDFEYTEKEKSILIDFRAAIEEQGKRRAFFEAYESTLIWALERTYNREIIKYWHISKIIQDGDKFILKWSRRIQPQSEEKLDEMYGKEKKKDSEG